MQAYVLETMFCSLATACAIDFTFQFLWLRKGFVTDDGDHRFSTHVNMSFLQ